MKQLIIIIRPNAYSRTKAALTAEHFYSVSTKDILGRGKRHIPYNVASGEGVGDGIYNDSMTAKKMLEIYVRDEDEQRLIDTVLKANRTGNAGDGKIFVIPAEGSLRIHTGERDDASLI